jgi:copper transport protein
VKRLLGGLLLGLVMVLLTPGLPAQAHAELVRTSPQQGEQVETAPAEVVVTFSEHVTAVPSKIQVIAPNGKRVDKGNPTVNGDSLHIPVSTDVPRGTYLVTYRVISADAHPVGASFTYSYGAPSAAAPVPVNSAGHTDVAVRAAVSVARGIGYVGLILVAGPALVLLALWPRRMDRGGPIRLAFAGLGLIALSTVLEFLLEAPYSTGGGLFDLSGGALRDVFDSTFGHAHLVRFAVVVAAAFLIRPFLAGTSGPAERMLLGALAVIGVLTWPFSGHPGSTAAPALTIVADAAHLAGIAVWVGGLVMLVAFLLRRARRNELAAILPVWSTWATIAVSVIVLGGVAQALVEVGSFHALVSTRYGALVLTKAGVLVVVLAVAALSRRLAAAPTDAGISRLRRTVAIEAVGVVVLLGLASVLVQTTPARTAVANASAGSSTSGPFSVTLSSNLFQVQIDVDPAKSGENSTVHLYAYDPQGAPLKVLAWDMKAQLPGAGIEPITVPLVPFTDSHASGQVTFPRPGNWQLTVTLQVSKFDQGSVSTEAMVT